eukprot:jgi/Hompol1/4428/HPOL_007100-RA
MLFNGIEIIRDNQDANVVVDGESHMAQVRNELSKISGVKLIDMTAYKPCLDQQGRGIKPFAALASSFREVILMDADALFFQRPEVLFE